jgi:hypothetical protein
MNFKIEQELARFGFSGQPANFIAEKGKGGNLVAGIGDPGGISSPHLSAAGVTDPGYKRYTRGGAWGRGKGRAFACLRRAVDNFRS